jgi:hypothetical protein
MTSAKKTCRKRRFRNEFEAEKWLKRMLWHVGRGDLIENVPQRVYYHKACNGFHTTSRPPREDMPDALLHQGGNP